MGGRLTIRSSFSHGSSMAANTTRFRVQRAPLRVRRGVGARTVSRVHRTRIRLPDAQHMPNGSYLLYITHVITAPRCYIVMVRGTRIRDNPREFLGSKKERKPTNVGAGAQDARLTAMAIIIVPIIRDVRVQ